MSWLSDTLFGKKPSIQTKELHDPVKESISNPLSGFLASRVGKGIDAYPGEVAPNIDPNYTNRYSEFMGLNANDLFDKYVANPQTAAFKRDFLPQLQEGYAGSLRGSGRYRSEEDAVNKFSQDLSGLRYQANKEIPEAQFKAAQDYYTTQANRDNALYMDWWKRLPENSPVLDKALQFLGSGTDTGLSVLSYLNPGQKGYFGDILTTLASGSWIPGATGNQSAGQNQGTPITGATGGQSTSNWWGGSA